MSTSLIRCACLAVWAVWPLAGLSTPARAAEQIVLPFDCNVVTGRVQVRPSGDQAYRIYGARRQDQYRACSERDPERCRTFLVHSFQMACGRDRAAWPDVYAAIAKVTDGRAFHSSDGRLYYRMGPSEPQDGYPFPAPRPARGVVEMPDGFAPMAGVDAIFTPLDPRVAELEDVPPAVARTGREPAVPAVKAEIAAEGTPKEAAPSKPVTTAKATEPPKPVAPSEAAARAEPDKPDAGSSQSAPPKAEPSTPVSNTDVEPAAAAPITPTILNNPAAKDVEAASKTETVIAAAEIAPSPEPASPASQPPRVEGWMSDRGPGLAVPPIVFAILIAAATLAILFVILKKQAAGPAAAAGPLRIPIEPSLPGLDPTPAGTSGQALVLRETPAVPSLSSGAAVANGVPATREDALALLGLSAGATDAAIRKIVEALRQSWHPDLAADEVDRSAREERIKAINAAADILQRKSAA